MASFANDDVYLPIPPPSESFGFNDRMDDFQDQFDKIQKELMALRGKELFGQNGNDMCLVPNVRIPIKLKEPEFKKYKVNTFPRAHLMMYVRRMSTHIDDQQC